MTPALCACSLPQKPGRRCCWSETTSSSVPWVLEGPSRPSFGATATTCRCCPRTSASETQRSERRSRLRGDVQVAVEWYLAHGRVRPGRDTRGSHRQSGGGLVRRLPHGKSTVLLAWKRTNVAELNARAREVIEEAGMLQGPEIRAPGGGVPGRGQGRAPCPGERGRARHERAGQGCGRRRETGEPHAFDSRKGESPPPPETDVSAERLDHAYAMTVHRTQGATTEVSHLFSDGGGRELAYVAMSRARKILRLLRVRRHRTSNRGPSPCVVGLSARRVSDLGFADAPQANAAYERPELSPDGITPSGSAPRRPARGRRRCDPARSLEAPRSTRRIDGPSPPGT